MRLADDGMSMRLGLHIPAGLIVIVTLAAMLACLAMAARDVKAKQQEERVQDERSQLADCIGAWIAKHPSIRVVDGAREACEG